MKVHSNKLDMTVILDTDEDSVAALRDLQNKAPGLRIVALSENKEKVFVVCLGELALEHWSLSRLNVPIPSIDLKGLAAREAL